jgi:hypothetical protein
MEFLACIEQLTDDVFPTGGSGDGVPARIRCITLANERMRGVLPENTLFRQAEVGQ